MIEKLRTLPGVDEVGITSRLPLTQQSGLVLPYAVEGQPRQTGSPESSMEVVIASPGYFAVMGIQLLHGRLFTEQDAWDVDGVVIVDEEFARRTWPNADPIRRRIQLEGVHNSDAAAGVFIDVEDFRPRWTVVGVVARVKMGSLSEQGSFGQASLPAKQMPGINASVVLKSLVPRVELAGSIREQVRNLDAAQPVHNMRTIEDVRNNSLASERLTLILLSAFAFVALTVSLSGLYGVLAYSVARRRREIGVRTALGARPTDVLRLILGEGIRLTATGILLGIIASLWFTRSLSSLLFQTRPFDPATFSAVALMLLAVAFAACWIPAYGAATTDSVRALRDE